MELGPWDRLQEVLPPPSDEELGELEASIERHGVLHPVLALPDGRIIDGVHRWRIARKLGKEVPCEVLDLSEDAAFALGVVLNVGRRNLSPEQAREARRHLRKLALELRRQGKTQEEIAGLLGVPRRTIRRWLADGKEGSNGHAANAYTSDLRFSPKLRVAVPQKEYEWIHQLHKEGKTQKEIAAEYKISQARVSQIIKRVEREKQRKTPEPPKGRYSVIIADPPWEYEFEVSGSRAVEAEHPTMSLEEICSLEVPAADDAILFLWVPKLREGLRVLEAGGFKTGMVWVKDRVGMGYHVRSRHELVLMGTRGSIGVPPPERRPESVVFAPRGEHSEKPEELHEIAERMYPDGRYLELFARRRREGWTAWGDEVARSA